ncbi:hypothetical protein ACFZB4_42515 [Streptomyces pseudovenezuelae]|uniref:hypothetical protein n=1 Tax=Streptomyces pseudovenezuelae TaxID=67350 RepID=UPI0036F07FDD
MPSIMTLQPVLDDRPQLPSRPAPHERDGRQGTPSGGRPHPQAHAAPPDPSTLEALRRVVDAQIGPRGVGAIYQNSDGAFEVIAVIRDPAMARGLLKRRCAQWALIVKDVTRAGGEPFAIGSVWTTSDYLVREADNVRRTEAFA